MAKRREPSPRAAALSIEQMRRGIVTFERRVSDLEKFDPNTASSEQVAALEKAIDEAIVRVFGERTTDYDRYRPTALLDMGPISIAGPFGSPPRDTRKYLAEGKLHAIATLNQAITALRERIEEAAPLSSGQASASVVEL